MRFIHTADWQLGKPYGRIPAEARSALQEARLDAIDTLSRAARDRQVTTVLVAGDVFDTSEPGDRVFRQALARMASAQDVRWLLLPGNHDPARADGLWWRLRAEAPDNVTACLESIPVRVADGVVVLPAPLLFKRTVDDPTNWFDHSDTAPGDRRIGLAHASIRDFKSDGAATNLIPPDRARRSGLDYLALGDWHGRIKVDDRTFYSGTPEPDDFGRETTGVALLVEMGAAGDAPKVSDLPVARYAWVEADWQVSNLADLDTQIAALAPGVARQDLVARVALSGLVTLGERVSIRERLEHGLAHDLRWLDLRMNDLFARPTDHDLADIDAHGVLRDAAERLRTLAADPGPTGLRASAALERLYVEHQRAQRLAAT